MNIVSSKVIVLILASFVSFLVAGNDCKIWAVVEINCDVNPVRFRESEQNNLHKYYLSVSNVAYNNKVKALQMTTRFFIDDLEDVLSLQTDSKILIDATQDLKGLKSELSRYLSKKMELTADGKKRTIDYLGGEIENDQVVLYIEIPMTQEPQTVSMKFTAFQELFEDQKNMVHFKLHGQRGTLLMTREKPTDILKLS